MVRGLCWTGGRGSHGGNVLRKLTQLVTRVSAKAEKRRWRCLRLLGTRQGSILNPDRVQSRGALRELTMMQDAKLIVC